MDEILDFLNARHGASEASEVRTFEVYIGTASVTVEVHDHGARAVNQRYMVRAFSTDIPEAERVMNTRGDSLGNPDPTLKGALMNVHWNVFENAAE